MSRHEVKIAVGGQEVRDWESYEVRLSVLEPVSTAALVGAFDRKRAEALPVGASVTIAIDRRPVFTGHITSRTHRGRRLDIRCHDSVWQLVQGTAPLRRVRKDSLRSLAEVLAEGVFAGIKFSNARNRDLYRRGNRRTGNEPPVFDRTDDPVKIPPGTSRWTALAEVLRRAELLAWASGDGRDLVLARPNFAQEPRFDFRLAESRPSTCDDVQIAESIERGYRRVTVVGQSRVPPASPSAYGINLRRSGSAEDETFPLDMHRRVVEEVRSLSEAEVLAQAHLDDARADAFVVTVDAWQHGQHGRLYVPDTVADVSDERNGFAARLYLRAVTYRGSRTDERSAIELVPLHTRMVIQ